MIRIRIKIYLLAHRNLLWDILRLLSSHRAALGLYVILTLWQTWGANQRPYALLHRNSACYALRHAIKSNPWQEISATCNYWILDIGICRLSALTDAKNCNLIPPRLSMCLYLSLNTMHCLYCPMPAFCLLAPQPYSLCPPRHSIIFICEIPHILPFFSPSPSPPLRCPLPIAPSPFPPAPFLSTLPISLSPHPRCTVKLQLVLLVLFSTNRSINSSWELRSCLNVSINLFNLSAVASR